MTTTNGHPKPSSRSVGTNKLKELTSSIDFNAPYDVNGHHHINTLSSKDAPFTLPPSLVFYAARNILRPSFILGQIPDLLNLLAVIETFRHFAVLKSDEALEWQKYYESQKTLGHDQDVRLLAANEVRALQRFLEKKDTQRKEYIVLVRSLVQLYIHYLWTAPESCLLVQRLNDFFPGSIQSVDKPSELLFHIDLSEEEKEYFGRLSAECQDWIKLVVGWESKRGDEGLSQENMEVDVDEFHAVFPQPSKPPEAARNVEIYMRKVEDIVRKLEQWFPPSGK